MTNYNSNFNSAISTEEIKRQVSIADAFNNLFPDNAIKHGQRGNINAIWRKDINASVSVNWDKGVWKDHGAHNSGGSVIDLVMVAKGCNFSEAQKMILDMNITPFFTAPYPHRVAESRMYIVEVKDLHWFPLKKYLLDRGLEENVFPLVKEIHYRNGDNGKIYKSIGFKLTDNDGWVLRSGGGKDGKGFKGCTKQGTTHLSFHRGNKLVVFEGFINLLTYYTVYGDSADYLCLNSTTNAHKVASTLSRYEKIELWLDNDEAGNRATKEIIALDETKYMIDMRYKFYEFNDLNDYWLNGGRKDE